MPKISTFEYNHNPNISFIIKMLLSYKLARILLIAILLNLTNSIEIELRNEQTCIDYIVDEAGSRKIFFFHYNHNMDNVNMVLYYKSIKEIWHQTGFGIEFKNYLEVQYKDAGNYTLCFIKKSAGVADVSFQILDEASRSNYAGKEQLARLTKRVSEFLMEIKKVGWTFKQVLQQHNSRRQTIAQQQNSYGYLLALKTVVMAVIIGVQIFVIKRIFK